MNNTVRVINYRGMRDELSSIWIDQLQHAGLLRCLSTEEIKTPTTRIESGIAVTEYDVLEFYAPSGVDVEAWAKMEADRMSSFGINAVAAPKWGG